MKKLVLTLLALCLLLGLAQAEGPGSVMPSTEEEIAQAMLFAGDSLTFHNPDPEKAWPMVVVTLQDGDEERTCLMSTNAGVPDSASVVTATFDAQPGDAFSMLYRLSTELGYDELLVVINGETVKRLSGERDWSVYLYEITQAGEYTVELRYVKDDRTDSGEDTVWLDHVYRVTGELAAELLAGYPPAYHFSEANGLSVYSDNAREVIIQDEGGKMADYFGENIRYYVVEGDQVEMEAAITAAIDPDSAFAYSSNNGLYPLWANAYGDGFFFYTGVDSLQRTGMANTIVELYGHGAEPWLDRAVLFGSEEDLEMALTYIQGDGASHDWRYADETPAASGETPAGEPVTYDVIVFDQNGDAVEGVQFRLETAGGETYTLTTDEAGFGHAEVPVGNCTLSIQHLPLGYAYDGVPEWNREGGLTMLIVYKPELIVPATVTDLPQPPIPLALLPGLADMVESDDQLAVTLASGLDGDALNAVTPPGGMSLYLQLEYETADGQTIEHMMDGFDGQTVTFDLDALSGDGRYTIVYMIEAANGSFRMRWNPRQQLCSWSEAWDAAEEMTIEYWDWEMGYITRFTERVGQSTYEYFFEDDVVYKYSISDGVSRGEWTVWGDLLAAEAGEDILWNPFFGWCDYWGYPCELPQDVVDPRSWALPPRRDYPISRVPRENDLPVSPYELPAIIGTVQNGTSLSVTLMDSLNTLASHTELEELSQNLSITRYTETGGLNKHSIFYTGEANNSTKDGIHWQIELTEDFLPDFTLTTEAYFDYQGQSYMYSRSLDTVEVSTRGGALDVSWTITPRRLYECRVTVAGLKEELENYEYVFSYDHQTSAVVSVRWPLDDQSWAEFGPDGKATYVYCRDRNWNVFEWTPETGWVDAFGEPWEVVTTYDVAALVCPIPLN